MLAKASRAEFGASIRLGSKPSGQATLCRLSAASAFLLCSCAADGSPQWTKPGVVAGQLEVDTFVCQQWSGRKPELINAAIFDSCMRSNGWRRVNDSGGLETP